MIWEFVGLAVTTLFVVAGVVLMHVASSQEVES